MYNIQIPFGKSHIKIDLPFSQIDLIYPPSSVSKKIKETNNIIVGGLKTPVSTQKKTLNFSKKEIAIVINDTTRPIPYSKILPHLINYLEENGAKRTQLKYYVATGTHRYLSSKEILKIIPQHLIIDNQVFCHDCDDNNNLQHVGTTKLKTPVIINSGFYQADIKIVTGNIEPHHFMGYSGGVKSASIGLAGRETIEKNHRMLLDPLAKMGTFESNPMRMDVEEIGTMIPVDFALNIVQNYNKEIEACIFGTPYSVMVEGIDISRKKTQINTSKKYDLVIASPGGYPKDINFYQAQKAISNACLFAKKNGVIIIIAECEEGSGNQDFEDFIKAASSQDDLMKKFTSTAFKLGPHKAFLLGLQSMNYQIILVSSLPDSFVERLYIRTASCFDDAQFLARKLIGPSPQVVVLPYATHCIPAQKMVEDE